MIDVTDILIAIIGLIVAVLTAKVIPWVKGKIGAQSWNTLQQVAAIAVAAAEQIGGKASLPGTDKLDYALAQVKAALAKQGITYNDATVLAAIEAAVYNQNTEKG